jgi:hypothetical protein
VARPLEEVTDVAADHVPDCRLAAQLAAGGGADPPAVPEDGDPVGDLEDLVHPVRDEEDRDATLAE